jgi:hypothetical protein
MLRKYAVYARALPAMTLGLSASLGIAACGTSATPWAAARDDRVAHHATSPCTVARRAYLEFLHGRLPAAPDGGNNWDALIFELGNSVGDANANLRNPLTVRVVSLENAAAGISIDISQQGAGPQDYRQFDSDLQRVAQMCDLKLAPLPKAFETGD